MPPLRTQEAALGRAIGLAACFIAALAVIFWPDVPAKTRIGAAVSLLMVLGPPLLFWLFTRQPKQK